MCKKGARHQKALGVVQVLADVRLITSKVFAAQYSLRFPRIKRVRWDKSAADVQTQEDLWTFLEANRHGTGAPPLLPHPHPVTTRDLYPSKRNLVPWESILIFTSSRYEL